MQVSVLIMLLGCATLTVFFARKFYNSRAKLLWAPAVWTLLLYSFVNLVSPIYYMVTGDSSVFFGIRPSDIEIGLLLNLVFIVCWSAGYTFMANKTKSARPQIPRSTIVAQKQVFWGVILVSLAAQVWASMQGFGYAYSQNLYAISAEQAGAYGIVQFVAGLLGPSAAAMLCLRSEASVHISWRGIHHPRGGYDMSSAIINGLLWLILIGLMISGLVLEMQRGDFLAPALLAGFVLIYRGKFRNAVALSSLAVVLVMLLSPVIDIARSEQNTGSSSNFLNAYKSYTLNEWTSSFNSLSEELAKKGVYPVSSSLLHQRANEDGFVGFATYSTIPYDLVPRFIVPDKPYPLSVDGTASGSSMFTVGAMLGNPDVTYWTVGGGVMYWQFGWIGVVLGGLAVGMIWARLIREVVYGPNFIITVGYLVLIGAYGQHLFESLDFVVHDIVRTFLLLSPLWLLAAILRSMNASVFSRKALTHRMTASRGSRGT